MIIDLLPTHVAGADWPDERRAIAYSQGKDDQHAAPILSPADRLEPLFAVGMLGVR